MNSGDKQRQVGDLITTWLRENKPAFSAAPPDASVDLLKAGMIDSLDYLLIVEYVGEKLGCDIDIGNFDDVPLGTMHELTKQICKQAP